MFLFALALPGALVLAQAVPGERPPGRNRPRRRVRAIRRHLRRRQRKERLKVDTKYVGQNFSNGLREQIIAASAFSQVRFAVSHTSNIIIIVRIIRKEVKTLH